jgi:hypothetical protein
MYTNIIKRLKSAKQSGNDVEIKKALIFFAVSLNELAQNISSYQSLATFSHDPDMIFESKKTEFSNSGPDVEIYSTGLLDQLLEMINIKEHVNISNAISDAVSDLHAELSRGNKDVEKEKSALISALVDLKQKISF